MTIGRTMATTTNGPRPGPSGHLSRDVGFWGLMFVSLGSIIGSGWLLGALTAPAPDPTILRLPGRRRHRALPPIRVRAAGGFHRGLDGVAAGGHYRPD